MKYKINITFDCFTLQRLSVISIIRKCIEATLQKQRVEIPCEINVLVTNNPGIQAINLASRNIDNPTDVLSFPMFSFEAGTLPESWDGYIDPETGLCPLGDMAISLERAIAQAKDFGHSTRREVGYLTIHSILHLLGWDHMEEKEKAEMFALQESIFSSLNEGEIKTEEFLKSKE